MSTVSAFVGMSQARGLWETRQGAAPWRHAVLRPIQDRGTGRQAPRPQPCPRALPARRCQHLTPAAPQPYAQRTMQATLAFRAQLVPQARPGRKSVTVRATAAPVATTLNTKRSEEVRRPRSPNPNPGVRSG